MSRVHVGIVGVCNCVSSLVQGVRIEGAGFGGTPVEGEPRLGVEDSPSAAGNVLDAVRYMRLAQERGIGGVVDPAAALLMEAPPRPMDEPDAFARLGAMVGA